LQQQYRMRQDRQFRYVYRRGIRAGGRDLSLLYVRSRQKRVGFSVGKKVGGAVVRNRVKRRLREVFRTRIKSLPSGLYVVVARPGAAEASLAQLCMTVNGLLGKLQKSQRLTGAP